MAISVPLASCEIISGLNRLVIVEETSGAAGQAADSGGAGATWEAGGESGRGGRLGTSGGGQSEGGSEGGGGGAAASGGDGGNSGIGGVAGGESPDVDGGTSNGGSGPSAGGAAESGPGGASGGGGRGAESGGAAVTSGAAGVAGSSGDAGGGAMSIGAGNGAGGEGAACETCGGDECVDLDTSLEHCGACGRECSTLGVATPVCQSGVCTSTCRTGYGNCNEPDGSLLDDGCETNTASEVYNCGACGRACLTTTGVDESRCGAGVCTSTCLEGYANVNRPAGSAADDGCEVDTTTNVDHCGASGRACASTQVADRRCEAGLCMSTCANGHGNLSHPAAPAADDGCESSCPGTGGPAMVRLPEGYCIDSTEVTQGQYQEWLDGAPPTTGQLAECSWNTSYEPTCDWSPDTRADYPVVCVDWCDAYAYCLAVGKRLCGKIGGGPNGYDDYSDASQSQWYSACASGTTGNVFPYGDSYEADTCNGYDHDAVATVPVGSLNNCESGVAGYAGVYDLSGNVREWEDSCDGHAGLSDHCRLRGGSFYYNGYYVENGLRCDYYFSSTRDDGNDDIGFRCCAP